MAIGGSKFLDSLFVLSKLMFLSSLFVINGRIIDSGIIVEVCGFQ